VRARDDTPDELRHKLGLVNEARELARALGLEVDEQYTSFVPWPEDRIITSVVATPPEQVDADPFWFPIIGRVPYKGYFDPAKAEAEAERLRGKGLDACTFAIDAYSTLGWFDDPITEPMLDRSDGALVETIVHELVHATFYVKSQPDFNEGAAQFVGQEAAKRFYAGDPEAVAGETARIADRRLLAATLVGFREEFRALYADAAERRAAGESPDVEAERAALEADMRTRVAALPLTGRDPERLAEQLRLNDACLALQGTYGADLETYADRLAAMQGDLTGFVAALRIASEADDPRATFFDTMTDTASQEPR
jgi:predicted aminopeptidase